METTLNTLKNLYAQEQGYEDWTELAIINELNADKLDRHWTEICIRAQKEALEKATKNAYIHYPASNNLNPYVDETTITNPENLIR